MDYSAHDESSIFAFDGRSSQDKVCRFHFLFAQVCVTDFQIDFH